MDEASETKYWRLLEHTRAQLRAGELEREQAFFYINYCVARIVETRAESGDAFKAILHRMSQMDEASPEHAKLGEDFNRLFEQAHFDLLEQIGEPAMAAMFRDHREDYDTLCEKGRRKSGFEPLKKLPDDTTH